MSWSTFHPHPHQYKVIADLQLCIWLLHFMTWNSIQPFFFLSLNTNSLTCLFCRLVVWSLRSLQSERHILPKLIQCGPLQWHKVVLLEGSKYDGYNDNHDGAPGKLLMAWCPPQMKNTLDIVHAGKEFKSDCWWSQAPDKLEWRFSSGLWTCAHWTPEGKAH